MNVQPSLKKQNEFMVRCVLVLHGLGFAYVILAPSLSGEFSYLNLWKQIESLLAPGAVSVAVIAIAKLMLLGLVPPQLRDRLIHWRWQNPLPGSRAFSNIEPKDRRIDLDILDREFGPLPSDPGEQDRLFYHIYCSQAEMPGVLDAHGSYLATRDIATINLILFFLLPCIALWGTGKVDSCLIYAAFLFSAYVLAAFAAQVYSMRFVENTLAVASAKPQSKA